MLDQTFYAAQAGRADEDFRFRCNRHRSVVTLFRFKRKHSAERRHLSGRDLVSGVRLQPGIMHARHFRMSRQEARHFHCVFRMRAHSPRQRAHAAQDKPAIERRGDRAALVLNAADSLEKSVVCFGNDNSSQNVAMAAKIFRRGVQD